MVCCEPRSSAHPRRKRFPPRLSLAASALISSQDIAHGNGVPRFTLIRHADRLYLSMNGVVQQTMDMSLYLTLQGASIADGGGQIAQDKLKSSREIRR
jgi:hypothetical protein